MRQAQTLGVDELVADAEPDADTAALVLSGLQLAASRGVVMMSRLVFRRAGNEPPEIARYLPSTDSLVINLDDPYWDDPDTEMALYRRQRLFPSANPCFPVLHEMAHRTHYFRMSDSARWSAYRAMSLTDQERRIVREEVGRNAAINPLELVADVFAAQLDGLAFSSAVMTVYRRYGGPAL